MTLKQSFIDLAKQAYAQGKLPERWIRKAPSATRSDSTKIPSGRWVHHNLSLKDLENRAHRAASILDVPVVFNLSWRDTYLQLVETAVQTGREFDLPIQWFREGPSDSARSLETKLAEGVWISHNLNAKALQNRIRKLEDAQKRAQFIDKLVELGEELLAQS